eukprot:gene1818-2939_t
MDLDSIDYIFERSIPEASLMSHPPPLPPPTAHQTFPAPPTVPANPIRFKPQKSCSNCLAKSSPQWRKVQGTYLCNACGLWYKRYMKQKEKISERPPNNMPFHVRQKQMSLLIESLNLRNRQKEEAEYHERAAHSKELRPEAWDHMAVYPKDPKKVTQVPMMVGHLGEKAEWPPTGSFPAKRVIYQKRDPAYPNENKQNGAFQTEQAAFQTESPWFPPAALAFAPGAAPRSATFTQPCLTPSSPSISSSSTPGPVSGTSTPGPFGGALHVGGGIEPLSLSSAMVQARESGTSLTHFLPTHANLAPATNVLNLEMIENESVTNRIPKTDSIFLNNGMHIQSERRNSSPNCLPSGKKASRTVSPDGVCYEGVPLLRSWPDTDGNVSPLHMATTTSQLSQWEEQHLLTSL